MKHTARTDFSVMFVAAFPMSICPTAMLYFLHTHRYAVVGQ